MQATDVLLESATFALICIVLCLPALGRWRRAAPVIAAALFLFADDVALSVRHVWQGIYRLPGTYNWNGKLCELLLDLAAIALCLRVFHFDLDELGLRWHLLAGTLRDTLRFVLPILLIETVALWFMVKGGRPTVEDHIYQIVVPGITEELAYRGILFALLNRAFPQKTRILNADLGWAAVVTSILFGLMHGLSVSVHHGIHINWAVMIIPLLGGFVLAWARARSGTVLLPILLHGLMNESVNLIDIAKR